MPEGDGSFVVAHADGNIYVYEKVGLGGASIFYLAPSWFFFNLNE